MTPPDPANSEASATRSGPIRLTDFLDLPTLQSIQESFSRMAGLHTVIRDAEGTPVCEPTDPAHQDSSREALWWLIAPSEEADGRFSAPIEVEGEVIGSITIDAEDPNAPCRRGPAQTRALADQLELAPEQAERLAEAFEATLGSNQASAVQLVILLANSIARLCYQEYELRHRVEELSTLYRLSTMLAGYRDLDRLLDHAARSTAEAMGVKAAAIRLLDEHGHELTTRAVYNLSRAYLEKGPLVKEKSSIYQAALDGEVVAVENLQTDPRVLYPEEAAEEGLVSGLFAGIIYQNRPIGVLQVGTVEPRIFSDFEKNLLQATAQLLATAIENARLDQSRRRTERVQRQLALAADVQRRMLPRRMPEMPPLDVAARYVPSFELSGDFYDFLKLEGHLGMAIGDVAGKGVAASLLMASVRASLRAYAQDLYDIDQIMSRVNAALTRDTLDNEFATLFYGVIDPGTMRLTCCNAGHEPPLLLRGERVISLDVGGMIVGVDASATYERALVDLEPGDTLLLYTDGLIDARNEAGEAFGRRRAEAVMRETAGMGAERALDHILWHMRRFAGLHRLIDDTTLVAVRIAPGT